MNELKKLTRSFHDQSLNKIKWIDDNTLEITITATEVGEEFGYNGDNEAYWAYPEEFEKNNEYERVIQLIFYGVTNLEKQIDFDKIEEMNLDIHSLDLNDSNVCLCCENNHDIWEEIKFNSTGFDLIYLIDKEKKI